MTPRLPHPIQCGLDPSASPFRKSGNESAERIGGCAEPIEASPDTDCPPEPTPPRHAACSPGLECVGAQQNVEAADRVVVADEVSTRNSDASPQSRQGVRERG